MERFPYTTPEACGISSSALEKMIRKFDRYGFAMHSMMMSRGGKVFLDVHWAPFHNETHHRMNSVTKSFVGIAIGLLEEDGKLKLTDRVMDYFSDYDREDLDDYTKRLTVYDLLTMRTSMVNAGVHWVRDRINDRMEYYFSKTAQRPPQTIFHYDSTAAFFLCVIVEKLTGKSLTEFLMDRLLRELGFSEKTDCILGPDGYSWGDSGLLCRQRDLHAFARFLMDGGVWKGKRLMNAEFIRRATSKLSDSNESGSGFYGAHGYGYQIWQCFDGSFAFFGMGDQLVICHPKTDTIFVCTADNQGSTASRPVIVDTLFSDILSELSDTPLPENREAQQSLADYTKNLKLVSLQGAAKTSMTSVVNGVTYDMNPNPMKWKWFRLDFAGEQGSLTYENARGVKTLPFAINANCLTEFPEEGYPDMQMNVPCPDNRFPCASSAAWLEEGQLALRVQMTGKHLGGLFMKLGFTQNGEEVGVRMVKNTNCFLDGYDGYAGGRKRS